MLLAVAASGGDNSLLILVVLALAVLVLAASKKRSRYIPTRVKRQALAKFFLEHYSDGERAKKPLRLKNYEFDHIIPFSKGGSNDVDNIKVIPRKDNRRKGNRM